MSSTFGEWGGREFSSRLVKKATLAGRGSPTSPTSFNSGSCYVFSIETRRPQRGEMLAPIFRGSSAYIGPCCSASAMRSVCFVALCIEYDVAVPCS